MERDVVIEVSQLGKQYRLGEIGSGSLTGDFKNLIKRISGRTETQVIGENDRTQKAVKGDIVWAVKDINFSVKQGEMLSIGLTRRGVSATQPTRIGRRLRVSDGMTGCPDDGMR